MFQNQKDNYNYGGNHTYLIIFLVYRCAEGYMGPRCEYKDLDGSYLRKLHPIIRLSHKIKNHYFYSLLK